MMFTNEQIATLKNKLDPQYISKHPHTKKDYLESWYVINTANNIFGFDGWSYSVDKLEQLAHIERKNKDGKLLHHVTYLAIVTVTVEGITRQDTNSATASLGSFGDSIKGASTSAVSGALKRALRSFGNKFGIGLYDKKMRGVAPNPIKYEGYKGEGIADKTKAIERADKLRDKIAVLLNMDTDQIIEFNDIHYLKIWKKAGKAKTFDDLDLKQTQDLVMHVKKNTDLYL